MNAFATSAAARVPVLRATASRRPSSSIKCLVPVHHRSEPLSVYLFEPEARMPQSGPSFPISIALIWSARYFE